MNGFEVKPAEVLEIEANGGPKTPPAGLSGKHRSPAESGEGDEALSHILCGDSDPAEVSPLSPVWFKSFSHCF